MIVTDLQSTEWVLAAPFRAHIRRLQAECGLPWSVLALAAGVSPAAVRSLVFGRRGRAVRRISRHVAVQLINLDEARIAALPRRQVLAEPTIRRLRDLLAHGWPPGALARWCHTTPAALRSAEQMLYCSELFALRVEAALLAHERAQVSAIRATGIAA